MSTKNATQQQFYRATMNNPSNTVIINSNTSCPAQVDVMKHGDKCKLLYYRTNSIQREPQVPRYYNCEERVPCDSICQKTPNTYYLWFSSSIFNNCQTLDSLHLPWFKTKMRCLLYIYMSFVHAFIAMFFFWLLPLST